MTHAKLQNISGSERAVLHEHVPEGSPPIPEKPRDRIEGAQWCLHEHGGLLCWVAVPHEAVQALR